MPWPHVAALCYSKMLSLRSVPANTAFCILSFPGSLHGCWGGSEHSLLHPGKSHPSLFRPVTYRVGQAVLGRPVRAVAPAGGAKAVVRDHNLVCQHSVEMWPFLIWKSSPVVWGDQPSSPCYHDNSSHMSFCSSLLFKQLLMVLIPGAVFGIVISLDTCTLEVGVPRIMVVIAAPFQSWAPMGAAGCSPQLIPAAIWASPTITQRLCLDFHPVLLSASI